MVKTLLLLITLSVSCVAQDAPKDHWLLFSQITLAGAATADAASSWGLHETNPIIGTGTFGARQLSIKMAFTGASLYSGQVMSRRHRRTVIIANFVATGLLTWATAHNMGQR